MLNLDYVCMQIVSQGQQNKLYKHVYVLRCNSLVIQDVNPAKEYLTVKLRQKEGVSFTDYHWYFLDKFKCDKLMPIQ